MSNVTAQLPFKLKPLFEYARYKIVYGGRGSSKSWSIARILIILASQTMLRIMCAREYQNSISESVHKLLVDQIDNLNLMSIFKITDKNITCTTTGSEFFFIGLKNNISKVKSTEGVDVCWVEEAETVSDESWKVLTPTIRKPKAEIWISFNPREDNDPTWQRYVIKPPPGAIVIEMNWRDNPWFNQTSLEQERLRDFECLDRDTYNHIWEGKTRKRSKAQIFADKIIVEPVKPKQNWNGPYYGLDWGFSKDPMRMVRVWVFENNLYIEREVNGVGIEMADIVPHLLKHDPFCYKYTIRADSSRPETISHVRNKGLPKVVKCTKGPNSVEEGISFIRSFKNIIIDPSCECTIEEGIHYKYKVDKITNEIYPEIVDDYNHSWDAVRYALEPLLPKRQQTGGIKVISNKSTRLLNTA